LSEHEVRINQKRNKLHQVLLTGKVIGNGPIGRQRGNVKWMNAAVIWRFFK